MMTNAKRAQLVELVELGLSDAAIGDALGLSARTILRHRGRLGLASQWAPELAECGTVGAYARGCRCEECRAANVEASRQHRALSNAQTPGPRSRAPWTPAEDAELLNGEGTLVARARRIGRSYNAAALRVAKLRRDEEELTA